MSPADSNSIVSDLFFGQFYSFIVCNECEFDSDKKHEIFTSVSLAVPSSDECDLHVIEVHIFLTSSTEKEYLFISLYTFVYRIY